MDSKITIGISACLFGQNTRYDGGNRHEPLLIAALSQIVTLVPLCPEAECGLGIPREPMRLEGNPKNPRLMTITTRCDLSERLQIWSALQMDVLARKGVSGLILKARSPSCGRQVAVHGIGEGETPHSPGLFARAWQERFPDLPIADEEELRDPGRLENFLKHLTEEKPNRQEKQR